MDFPAAIPAARLRHSKHLQLNWPTLTAVINASIVVVLLCRWAGPQPSPPPLDTGAVACLTTLYDIAISRFAGLRYCDTIFSHDTSPNCDWLYLLVTVVTLLVC